MTATVDLKYFFNTPVLYWGKQKRGFNWDGCVHDKSQTDSINLLGGGNLMLNAALLTKGVNVLKLDANIVARIQINRSDNT